MMNLEWRERLNYWQKTFPKLFFIPLGEVDFEGYTTFEKLTPEEALKGKFKPFPTGTKWGAKWEYAWFRGKIQIPTSAKGERIILKINPGYESVIWVNGSEIGTQSHTDREITLTRQAKGGEKFDILVETYSGHGVMESGGGPSPYGHEMIPEPAKKQVTVGVNQFGIWEEEMYQLWLDVETLDQVAVAQKDQELLRVAEIEEALKEMTLVVDLELPREEMLKTVRAGRELLRPVLEAKNGTTAPFMHCFGHAHIDVAWLWPLQETERKCARTFSSQLSLMDEYPEYKFLQSQPHLYRMAKDLYPELYKRVKKAVQKGQWIPEGGMWIESDTNLAGGESLIRQFIHGKRFFEEEFGVNSRLMWLPDVFGYSGALPQIMKGCEVDYFSTQKIFWLYYGGQAFPHNWFWWEGIDGSKILSYIHNDYNSEACPTKVHERWNERVQKEAFHQGRLFPFGWGDGGGGPTRNHLEFLRRQEDLQGSPRCKTETPVLFFDRMIQSPRISKVPTWVGELYFQAHRGTYTTQAMTKKGNRLSEYRLREAELWGAAASVLKKKAFPMKEMDELWKGVLLNQFHDIIPGSSIHRVYEEAEALYENVIQKTSEITKNSLEKLSGSNENAVTIFNSLSWEREEMVKLPEGFKDAQNQKGEALPTQEIGKETYALVSGIPSMGWTTLHKAQKAEDKNFKQTVRATSTSLENSFLRVTISKNGEITSILDKETGSEFAAEPCNVFHLYKDVPSRYDAWDVDSMYKLQPVPLEKKSQIEVGEYGPLLASIRVKKQVNLSSITQEIVLRANSRRLDFKTMVDWKESHKMLKVNFPVTVRSDDALHEIQFGHLRRPTHSNQPYDAARFEVSNHKWTALVEERRGAAVLNDCKYGVNVEKNSINLTLLRSSLAPDMTADKRIHEFTYSFYSWGQSGFAESGLVKSAYELNIPILTGKGDAGNESLFGVTSDNIIIETVKPAEDKSGDVIVRLYESSRSATKTELKTALPFKSVSVVNMLEKVQEKAVLKDGALPLEFRPFEIKTLRFSA